MNIVLEVTTPETIDKICDTVPIDRRAIEPFEVSSSDTNYVGKMFKKYQKYGRRVSYRGE